MPASRYPSRYRDVPRGPGALKALIAESTTLFTRATELDGAQQVLAVALGEVRTKLGELRIVMWPEIEPKDYVHGFRFTRRGGPPPIPPVASTAWPLRGKHLRSGALAILARNARPMTLVEMHRELHLNGYAIASREPVKRLANALAYEITKGRAKRVSRGIYELGELNPGERRRLNRMGVSPARRER